ncbi:DUF6542 domain-containing protein [Streptomyces sp. NPDC048639]|uniref:DUF6542 domain-containing protein n=1 Tax=Streptomyces sp. NPDC048639 TaxID=3365581 RepID=UPI00371E4988
MDHHRTRKPQGEPRLPEQESATVYRAAPPRSAPPVLAALRRLRRLERVPGPRFTGLGCGLLSMFIMFTTGALDEWLLDGSPFVYGLVFVLLGVAAGLWVRPADLIGAPVSAPIAFTAGLPPISGGEGGLGGHVMAVFTQLALHAGWLYGGTLAACLTVGARKVLRMGDRAAQQAQSTPAGAQSTERAQRA